MSLYWCNFSERREVSPPVFFTSPLALRGERSRRFAAGEGEQDVTLQRRYRLTQHPLTPPRPRKAGGDGAEREVHVARQARSATVQNE